MAGKKKPSRKERKKGKAEIEHCFDCNQICCRTAVIEVDPPKTLRDHSDLLFYLYHFDTEVVIAKSGGKKEWYVEFMSPCRNLVDGRCTIYEHRPLVCREYDMTDCEHNNKKRFTYLRSPDEFFKYLKKKGRKGIWKKLKKTHVPPAPAASATQPDAPQATRTRVDR